MKKGKAKKKTAKTYLYGPGFLTMRPSKNQAEFEFETPGTRWLVTMRASGIRFSVIDGLVEATPTGRMKARQRARI